MVSTTFTYPSRLRRDNYVSVVDTIHVADAVADTDETYGAYAAAENNTFNNANGNINNANNRNNNANNNNMYGQYLFLREDVDIRFNRYMLPLGSWDPMPHGTET